MEGGDAVDGGGAANKGIGVGGDEKVVGHGEEEREYD